MGFILLIILLAAWWWIMEGIVLMIGIREVIGRGEIWCG